MKYKLEGTFAHIKRSSSVCSTMEYYMPHLEDLKKRMMNYYYTKDVVVSGT